MISNIHYILKPRKTTDGRVTVRVYSPNQKDLKLRKPTLGDASKLRYSNVLNESLGENICGEVSSKNSENGNYMANDAKDRMMNQDESSNWGHRRNILKSTQHHIGIGAAYNGDGSYSLVEDFAGLSNESIN